MTPLDGEYKRIVCWMDGAALSLNHLSFAGHAFMVAANYYQLSKLIDIIALLAPIAKYHRFYGPGTMRVLGKGN